MILPRVIEDLLLTRANVIGFGLGKKNGTGPISVVVNVTKKLPLEELDEADVVPERIFGLLTDVVEIGNIRALSSHWPAHGGDSIGHVDITAGTLGCVVKRNGQRVILSNNHVLANSNDAEIGDPILQPGPYDGGQLATDQIGELEAFQPIRFGGLVSSDCPTANRLTKVFNIMARVLGRNTRLKAVVSEDSFNLVDAAVARPLDDGFVSDEIREIGVPEGLAQAVLGMTVQKTGRTTNHTTGFVLQSSVTIRVQYGAGKVATFRDQIISTLTSAPGDSGSAVLDSDQQLVGLLFAGNDQVTIMNRIHHVFDALDLEL